MTATAREQLASHLLELVEDFGPWAVLHVVTETLRTPFDKLAKEEAEKRPRAKKGEDLEGEKA